MKLEIVNKHAVYAEGEGFVLVDTGSPMTIGRQAALLVDLEEVSERIGRKIVKLLGTDNMQGGPVLIDYQGGKIEFDYAGDEDFPNELPCRMVMGIPTVTIKIAGEERRMFLDTGAPTSYIASTITAGMTPTGSVSDFHPQAGEFEVDTFEIETEIVDFKGSIVYGNLPAELAAQCKIFGCDGIIGYDLFSRFAVLLDVETGTVRVK